ncbi:hypothetical protein BJ165DRAFT_1410090 [Panaeolus papilionaceus]|nr:hypothetical protein BJ165DRAFT_1410090 [Panaeolus papilionaceus]
MLRRGVLVVLRLIAPQEFQAIHSYLSISRPFHSSSSLCAGNSNSKANFMERAPIPNDILQEIIGALAQSSTDETQTYPTEVKKFATLSSFCLQEARKHIFAKVQLKTGYTYRERCRKQSTLEEQLDFFSQHLGPLPYIRRLNLTLSSVEMLNEELQSRLFDMLIQLPHLLALDIRSIGPKYIRNRNQWTQIASSKSIRSALQILLHRSSNFRELGLWSQPDFPISDLMFATTLRRLTLDDSLLLKDEGVDMQILDVEHHLENLDDLKISDRKRGRTEVPSIFNSLLARGSNGELVLKFSHLKSLEVDFNDPSTFRDVSYLLKGQGCDCIESLKLNLYLERFNDIILPFAASLQKLSARIFIASITQDPFGGMCSTLERIQGNNVLTLLDIEVTVQTDCPCTTGVEWRALSRVMGSADQWKSLQEVNLKVVVADYGRPDNALQMALEGLRETHHKSLFSSSFNFNYERHVEWLAYLMNITHALHAVLHSGFQLKLQSLLAIENKFKPYCTPKNLFSILADKLKKNKRPTNAKRAAKRYIDDANQLMKFTGPWNFRSDTGALNGQYTFTKTENAHASVTYTFRSVDLWLPLFPATIQVIVSLGSSSTVVDLQDHDVPAVPLATDVPPRTSKPARVVWSYRGTLQQESTIYIRAVPTGSEPAYAIVDVFEFEVDDPPSTSSTTDGPPLPSPTTSTQRTSTTPTSTPSQSSSESSSSTPSSSTPSTASSIASTSSPISSDSNTVSSLASSSTTLLSLLPTTNPTVIQGNGGSLDSEGSRDKGNTSLIAGLSVAGCVLAGILAGLVWLIRRKRRGADSERDDGEERQVAFDPAEGPEAARPYSLVEKARLPGGNGAGGEGVIGLRSAFARVLGKRNVTMDASPTSTEGQSSSPGVITMNEKQGVHDAPGPLDSIPSSSAAQPPQPAMSNHGSDNLSPGGSSFASNDQPPQVTAAHSPITTRPHPPSMIDSPPTYTAADPTSALWAQRIQMAAVLPALVQQTQSPSLPVPSDRDSVVRVQMDPELD